MATTEEKMLEEAYSVTPNFSVDPNDPRFDDIKSGRQDAIDEYDQLYAGMINNSDQFYDKQIQASKDWADKQSQLQQEQTDFAIEQIEQQKDQANKDYIKEQSGAYVDWQKQSNQYGVNAEKMASAGLTNSGFSESSQVSMYNTYQNRVATAREVYNRAVLNYNNAIKDAQLQNNAKLAEIAYQALEKQLSLSLEGFQYKNQLILDQANKKLEIDNMYWNRYQDVLDQINHENDVKRDIWKYQDTQKWQTEQNEIQRDFEADQAQLDRDFEAAEAKLEREFKTAQAELERKHDKEMLEAETKAEKEILAQKHKNDLAILAQEFENEKAMLAYEKQLEGYSGGGGGGGSSKSSGSSSGLILTGEGTSEDKKTGARYKYNNYIASTQSTGFTGSTFEDAQAYMKKNGVPAEQRSALLSASEWSRRRTSYTTYGQGNADVANFTSYGAYLKAKVNYYVTNYGK